MVALLMLAVAVMILPLPTFLIDALIAWNIGASTLILVVVVYLPQPLAFSSLPAVILTATLFRLATEIAVTRMILVQVDAGNIVRAFGDFVVSGQVVVGLVTFLIITVVQNKPSGTFGNGSYQYGKYCRGYQHNAEHPAPGVIAQSLEQEIGEESDENPEHDIELERAGKPATHMGRSNF